MAFDPWEYQSPDDYRDQVLDAEEARIQQEIEDKETEELPAGTTRNMAKDGGI